METKSSGRARSGINPLSHYILEGEPAGRRPVSWFDPACARGRTPCCHEVEDWRWPITFGIATGGQVSPNSFVRRRVVSRARHGSARVQRKSIHFPIIFCAVRCATSICRRQRFVALAFGITTSYARLCPPRVSPSCHGGGAQPAGAFPATPIRGELRQEPGCATGLPPGMISSHDRTRPEPTRCN